MTPKDFSSLFPGMDFFKPWWPGATDAPSPWTTPTLDPEQLAKRIDELKTVKFWLENNVRMLDASIQALEVQRGTLATLSAMKLTPEHLQEALRAGQQAFGQAAAFGGMPGASAAAPAPSASSGPSAPSAPSVPSAAPQPAAPPTPESGAAPEAAQAPLVDPMRWWQQLGEQFQHLAHSSLQAVGEAASAVTPPASAPDTGRAPAKPARAPKAASAAKASKTASPRARKPGAGRS